MATLNKEDAKLATDVSYPLFLWLMNNRTHFTTRHPGSKRDKTKLKSRNRRRDKIATASKKRNYAIAKSSR